MMRYTRRLVWCIDKECGNPDRHGVRIADTVARFASPCATLIQIQKMSEGRNHPTPIPCEILSVHNTDIDAFPKDGIQVTQPGSKMIRVLFLKRKRFC